MSNVSNVSKAKKTLGVVGARGHVGKELLALVAAHPGLELALVTSRELAGQEAPGAPGLRYEDLDAEGCAARGLDALVLALPNGKSAPYVAAVDAGPRRESVIVDLSADHRFVDGWTYGLPERRRAALAGARRVANPGCYATAAQVALDPFRELFRADTPPHAFGVSGYSGAGTTPSPRNDPAALADSVMPYSLIGHVHEREVSAQLGTPVYFLPHVASFFRGLTVTASMQFASSHGRTELAERLRARWSGERLVRVVDEPPIARQAAGRHEVLVGGLAVADNGRHAVIVSALDNLLGGAATTALRNLNLALGFPEREGLETTEVAS